LTLFFYEETIIKNDHKNIEPASTLPELEIVDLNVDGGAIARLNGQVVFLDSGLPGDIVQAVKIDQKKKIILAKLEKIIKPSPSRVEPFCQNFKFCNGCSIQDLDYPAQLSYKKQRVEQVLSRIGGIDFKIKDVLPSPKLTGFRNKMVYSFGTDQDRPILGFNQRLSQKIVAVSNCPLQSPEMAALLNAAKKWAANHSLSVWNGKSGCLRRLILREPQYQPSLSLSSEAVNTSETNQGAQRSVELTCGTKLPDSKTLLDLWNILRQLGATSLSLTKPTAKRITGFERIEFEYGPDRLQEQYGSAIINFPVNGFAQTNTGAASLLYEKVLSYASTSKKDTIWDIYSGSGAMAIMLASQAENVFGLEQNEEAVKASRENAIILGYTNCHFLSGDATSLLDEMSNGLIAINKSGKKAIPLPDLIITDPPRSGMTLEGLTAIRLAGPSTIIYVSCDPGTLARDLKILCSKDKNSKNYDFDELSIIDMFPHTTHVETITKLVLSK